MIALALTIAYLANGDTSIAFKAPGTGSFVLMASNDAVHWAPWMTGPVAANGTASVLVKHCTGGTTMYWQAQFQAQ